MRLRCLSLLVLVLIAGVSLFAQTSSLSGTVVDPSGALIPAADVIVKSAAAGSRILRGPNTTLRKQTKTPLNMVAMLSAVEIQDASSKPNPKTPRRSGKPTLTNRAFKVAIPAPMKTPRIPR